MSDFAWACIAAIGIAWAIAWLFRGMASSVGASESDYCDLPEKGYWHYTTYDPEMKKKQPDEKGE